MFAYSCIKCKLKVIHINVSKTIVSVSLVWSYNVEFISPLESCISF